MALYEGIALIQEKQAVVLDLGSEYTKFGFTGEAAPRCIIKSEFWRTTERRFKRVYDYSTPEELYDNLVNMLHLLYFRYVLVNPKERKVVVVESLLTPTLFRETLAKVLFTHYEVSGVVWADSPRMCALTLGTPVTLVVNIGAREAEVAAVVHSCVVLQALQFAPLGSTALHAELAALLDQDNNETLNLPPHVIEDIKVKTCFVSPWSRAQQWASDSPPAPARSVRYGAGGRGAVLVSGRARELAAEVMFRRDNELDSLPDIILACIMKSPIDVRRELGGNVVVCGGGAALPGLLPRLRAELQHLVTLPPYNSRLRINEFKFHKAPAHENSTAWVGGAVCGAGAGGSHVLVPLDFDVRDLVTVTAHPVTAFWIKDCLCQQELVPLQYYHRPVHVGPWEHPPLKGVVASLSTYSGLERAFLDELAKLLGATTQLRFCRRNTANALASTHLICPTATGDKYVGALKWGLPAVRASWLMACASEGRRVSEKEHLVGDTRAPPSPEPIQDQIEEDRDSSRRNDKENDMLPPQTSAVPRLSAVSSRDETPAEPDNVEDMSPASRYIAMARQGLLEGNSQETPNRAENNDNGTDELRDVRTPPLEDALSSPRLAAHSPRTRRRLLALRRGELPSDPIRTPQDPFDKQTSTPDSAFGAALRPGSGRLSPDARKRLWRVVNDLPTKQPDIVQQKHTPLSEIRNRFLAQFNSDVATPPSEHTVAPRKLLLDDAETPPAKMMKMSQEHGTTSSPRVRDVERSGSLVEEQLQRLQAALSDRQSTQRARRVTRDSVPPPDTEPGPDSQPNTVGWDDTTPVPVVTNTDPIKKFMLSSNVDNREEIISMIVHLGGEVCEGTELVPEATHLLCATPGRSEKMLGSVAAGRWVLHPAYVARSRTHGQFLPEEEYEWGNPRATCLPTVSGAERVLARAAYRWRSGRAAGLPGPYAGLVALLHVPPARRRLLARLVTAGDGQAPDDEPPYSNENITVCFADIKRYPLSSRDSQWLISNKIPVCPPVLLSAYLTDDVAPRPHEHCLPEFRP